MKKYLAPEIEKVEYDVIDCLQASGEDIVRNISKESDDIDDFLAY